VQPIFLAPNQPVLFYRGGESIARFRGLPLTGTYQPEDWLGSTTAIFGTESGRTVLPDGRTLEQAIAADPVSFLGPKHVAVHGTDPGLLVKLLDAGERLPVHLHPPREFARQHLGCSHGKAEAWIVIGTSVPAPEVYLGFVEPVDAQTVSAMVAEQRQGELLAMLNATTVNVGDVIYVPAGTPHSLGAGVFIIEVQEPTDLSIMMEFARYGIDGAARGSLGLGFETALACVDRSGWDADRLKSLRGPGWLANGSARKDILPPEAAEFFRAERLRPGAGADISLTASFSILVAVEGAGSIETQSARLRIARGDTVLVPYAAGDLTVAGDVTIIRCRPPAVREQESRKKGASGKAVNRRAATMHDVAKLADVSAKTVSRVFNDEQHVTEKTRAKVELAMKELNFVPNMLARSFRVGYDRAIGVAIPDIADPFFAAMTRAIEEVALSRRLGVVISSLGRDPARERPVLEALLHRSIVGLIAVPIGDDQSYLAPWQQRTPVVFVDQVPAKIKADSVVVDDRAGAMAATLHLFKQGHRRIAFIGDSLEIATTRLRLEGYQAALAQAGVESDESLIAFSGLAGGGYYVREAMSTLLASDQAPTAIFSSNAKSTMGVVAELQLAGRKDIALVSYGDFPTASLLQPAITFVNQDPAHIGQAAAERLLIRIEQPQRRLRRKMVLPVNLVPRGSGELRPEVPLRLARPAEA
jgi:DNA-binding LacI/PurR family transcriptional regulator/mannose-6-phosphate isomerase class I